MKTFPTLAEVYALPKSAQAHAAMLLGILAAEEAVSTVTIGLDTVAGDQFFVRAAGGSSPSGREYTVAWYMDQDDQERPRDVLDEVRCVRHSLRKMIDSVAPPKDIA